MKTLLTFVVVLAAACGGTKTPAAGGPSASATSTPGASDHATAEHTHSGEHPNMGGEMTRFHDVLKPRWHAQKGPQRLTDTCAAVPDFQRNAAALAKSPPPASADAGSWSTATTELTVAVGGLDAACKSSPKDFESAFERVHTVFHALMELGNVKGHHAGEHGHKM